MKIELKKKKIIQNVNYLKKKKINKKNKVAIENNEFR